MQKQYLGSANIKSPSLFRLCFVFLTLVLFSGIRFAHAAEEAGMSSIGTIKQVQGLAHIERKGQKIVAQEGMFLYAADVVRTTANGSIGITLRDSTLLSAGANTVLELEKFTFDSTTHDGNMAAKVHKGTVAVATGKLAKNNPESVRFSTPTTVLGVRGTEFVIEVAG